MRRKSFCSKKKSRVWAYIYLYASCLFFCTCRDKLSLEKIFFHPSAFYAVRSLRTSNSYYCYRKNYRYLEATDVAKVIPTALHQIDSNSSASINKPPAIHQSWNPPRTNKPPTRFSYRNPRPLPPYLSGRAARAHVRRFFKFLRPVIHSQPCQCVCVPADASHIGFTSLVLNNERLGAPWSIDRPVRALSPSADNPSLASVRFHARAKWTIGNSRQCVPSPGLPETHFIPSGVGGELAFSGNDVTRAALHRDERDEWKGRRAKTPRASFVLLIFIAPAC